ncbi:hypothetical protein HJC23_011241 [Cyclotella cryptica]|uniref:CRC domain-containing protein n=1 Tax=Cyclotella cryptica TaxID=29204 RepID=A0ABD3QVP6_9STRA
MVDETNQDESSFVASLMAPHTSTYSTSNEEIAPVEDTTSHAGLLTQFKNDDKENSFSSSSYSNSSTVPPLKCNCQKTKCLQLYCECFHGGLVCSDQCGCVECKNSSANEIERLQHMTKVLKRNKDAFNEENSFSKKSRKNKSGCYCLSSHCLKKYCSCYWNKVECTKEKCGCTHCENPYGTPERSVLKHALINGMRQKSEDEVKAPCTEEVDSNPAAQTFQDLPQPFTIRTTEEQMHLRSGKTPQKSRGQPSIEHYTMMTTSSAPAFELQKEANFNTATTNLLALKHLLLQSKHKLFDLEFAMGELEDSNASNVRLERQMVAVRESVNSVKELEKLVKKAEEDIAQKYESSMFK